MNVTRTDFSQEELKHALGSKQAEAEAILQNEEKTEKLLAKVVKVIDKLKKVPVIGNLVDDIQTIVELIRDYIKGDYRKIPVRVIVSAVAALIYLVSPVDLIPDAIPILGWMDDAAIIALVLNAGLSLELSKYKKWKENTKREKVIAEARTKYFEEYETLAKSEEEK